MTIPGFSHWEKAFAAARREPPNVATPPALDAPDDTWGRFRLGHMQIVGRGEVMIVRAGPVEGDPTNHRHLFEIWVSEKARSVRLWVDQEEIPIPRRRNAH